jgi:hypothetical protein
VTQSPPPYIGQYPYAPHTLLGVPRKYGWDKKPIVTFKLLKIKNQKLLYPTRILIILGVWILSL